MSDRFNQSSYLIRKKVFKILGEAFHIYGPGGDLLFYSKMKAFKLKEDIRLYTGEDMQTEVLTIKARQIIDLSATYDVYDPQAGQNVGSLRRKGLKSMIKDEWLFLDPNDREVGHIAEDNLALALVRRFLTNLIPQTFEGCIGTTPVCTFKQNFNPFVQKIEIDFSQDAVRLLDRRLGLAAGVLLGAIEGRQN
jgi:uncharacterized protein YxjI